MSEPRINIIGGGITGLAAAYLLAREGHKVRVLEGSAQCGGLLNTFPLGPTRLEHYYHHFFTHDAEINWLLGELGLAHKILFRKTTMGVLRDGAIHPFNGPRDLLRFHPLGPVGKFRFAATSAWLGKFADWRQHEETAALSWFFRYAGKEVTEALWRPLLQIKFGPYHDQVPVAWMIGRLAQRMQSREAGDERLGYLGGSLQVLLDELLKALRDFGVEIHTEAPVNRIHLEGNRIRQVDTPRGDFTGDTFLFTIPTLYLTPLLENAGATGLAADLGRIEYFGAVCAILELKRPLSDIYWLNVADEGYPFGGVIEQTNFIPPEVYGGRYLAYLSRYFAPQEPLARMREDELRKTMLAPLPKVYPHFRESDLTHVHIFRTRTAATVCDLGFSRKVPPCRTGIDGLYLATMAHVYPDERSTNNAIRVAAEAVHTLGVDSSDVPRGRSLSGQIGFASSAES